MSDLPSRLTAALADRYRIERELGAGGMATVYLAEDLKHERDVAIKVLRQDVAQSIGAERFLQEIRLAAGLSHPNILPVFDSGEVAGLLFYVMPNVAGRSVRDLLDRGGPLSVDVAVRIAREVAEALDYAHRHGVVHRDIKPDNIMLHEGHALVADFGIGKAVGGADAQTLTQTGATVGTPAYMSPEQAAGEAVDGRSDLYALGCVLYEMLVGEQPFTGPTVQVVIAKRFIQTPPDITALREGVPRPVARSVQKALARTPIDRFETGTQFAAALAELDMPEPTAVEAVPEKSIAVLPFANLSSDPENEFFADGVTEEILNALSHVAELRVAGRMSSFSLKGKNQDLKVIGEQLHVRHVLGGSVRRAGKRVRITAQLVDATDGYHMWSEKYDREIEDVFAVQDEIATAIAAKMKTALNIGAAAKAQRAAASIEAYEAYLKGRALLYRRGQSIREGMELMEKALALDPEYGLAWSGLADTYSLLGYYAMMPPEVAREKAGEASAEALRLAPDLAESHTSRGLFALLFEWNWEESKREFERALEINPGYIQGAGWYHLFYWGFLCGRSEAVLRGLRECWARDPLSGYAAAVVGIGLCTFFRDREVLDWCRRAEDLDPGAFLTVWLRQLAQMSLGEWDDAIATGKLALDGSGGMALPAVFLGLSYHANGDLPAAESIYDELTARSAREHVAPAYLAALAAALGNREAVLSHLADAARRRDPGIVIFAHGWPGMQPLQALPEYQAILHDIGLTGWAEREAKEVNR
ncbi:MAG: protein kinase [Gemmatimonadetes bacterium]|nr:protein kinase [Gemmatimonadota bacterium]